MELYPLIVEATTEKDLAAAWEIIIRFEPYIKKECYNLHKGYVDEDMKSEIFSKLPGRILGFKIRPTASKISIER